MKNYDVVIIGGGASGLYAAININKTKKILIIEKSDRLGKKILATGNGKCNLTNTNISGSCYNTNKVDKYFAKYDNMATLSDFNKIGLQTYNDEEGRVYPLSNSANSVLDVLLKQVELSKNIDVLLNTKIIKIEVCNNVFKINTDNIRIETEKLIIATGGNSGKEYLQMLDVKYNDYTPSLVALKTEKNKYLAGVRVSDVNVKFKNFKENGEILFKEDGISGIVIFNLSTIFARNNLKTGQIIVDLLPNFSNQQLVKSLKESVVNNPNYTIVEILEGFVHKSLAKNIIYRLNINDKIAKILTNNELTNIADLIKNYKIEVTGLSDNNQVHSGGVSLNNLDENLMYNKIKNLYFVGEVIDVDGVCGGYNLQWAWTSGKIVGVAI